MEDRVARSREFTVQQAYEYNHASPLRWIGSHVWRYRRFVVTSMVCYITAWLVYAGAPVMTGRAAA